jgi:hypothetical protein
MEQTRKTHKARDLAIGFFGWFIVGSLVVWIIRFIDNWGQFIPPAVTVVEIGILLLTKRNWVVYGILTAVITNALVFILIFSVMGASVGELLSDGNMLIGFLSIPFFMVGGFY